MFRRWAIIAAVACPTITAVHVDRVAPSSEDKLEALQPVLEKLRNLDGKTFGMLSSMLSQAGAGGASKSFLQLVKGDEPADDTEKKLEALQPVLEKLRGLDGRTFGMLSNMLNQASAGKSFLQLDRGEPDATTKLEALQPVLEKLRGLDPKTFGMLSNMLGQAGSKEGISLLQVLSGEDPVAASKLEALQPVLKKLRGLDPKTFGMLSGMLSQANNGERSFLQLEDPDAEAKLEALQPVLAKLRGLDPKTFGMLSGMLGQAETPQGRSFLQLVSGEEPEASAKLEALQPVLEKLKGLDPKMFGMLSGMIAQAQSK